MKIMTEKKDGIQNKLINGHIPIVLIGPTATGKSELAILIAEALNGEIISLDSMQVYRGMDIGTGKIPLEERKGIPHHLIDVINPDRIFSAGEFQRLAEEKTGEVWKNRKTAIIVGGTGLYLRAFLKGLFPTPARSDAVRQRIEDWDKREGLDSLYSFLSRTDHGIRETIKPTDRQRIHRSLEIFLVTGKTPSILRESSGFAEDRFRAIKIGLNYSSRELLYAAIEKRVDSMFEAGWVDEVRTLKDRYKAPLHPFKAIGYREIIAYLDGNTSLESTISLIKQKTRNYAKRQITWYKKEEPIKWYDAGQDKELVCKEVLQYISAYIKDEGEFNNGSRAD
jgi:tRNA dimethylallyltransferase